MLFSWLLVPVLSAFIVWFINRTAINLLFWPRVPKKVFGISLQGLLPRKKDQLAGKAGSLAASELLSFNDIAQNISRPENVRKLMPYVETHIDHFLRVKLPEQMPVIGMFIGDKTIAQLKTVFTSELETLFPVVMEHYVQQLQGGFDLEKIIGEKLRSFPADKLERLIRTALDREFRLFGLIGGIAGFLIGCISVILTLVL
jgi:uncharacterized membrane protein YheB (UPF0754 family)